MSGTLILIDGFGWDGLMPLTSIVRRLDAEIGGTRLQLPYNNDVSSEPNMAAGVTTLNTYLTNIKNGVAISGTVHQLPVTVVGISMGSQLAAKWLRERGPTSTLTPSDVSFILMANPEQKFNGCLVRAPGLLGDNYAGTLGAAGVGIPDATPYDVTEFCRQWDGVGDFPNSDGDEANANALLGMALIHNFYFKVDIIDADVRVYKEQNRTYILSPSRWTALTIATPVPAFFKDKIDAWRAPRIETHYSRPYTRVPDRPVRTWADITLIEQMIAKWTKRKV